MKKERKEFSSLRRKVIKYNKALVLVFALFMVYALIHSVSMLDCSGIDYYNFSGEVTSDMLTCTNLSTGVLAFFTNCKMLICVLFLVAALVFLILQKVALYKINQLDVEEYEEEKVYKTTHILLTLLLGYTGIHKYRTQNRKVGHIYLVNFVVFLVSWIIKTFMVTTYESYLIFYCAYEFSVLFLIGIIILNIVEAIFSLLSLKDDEEKIFA